MWLRSEVEFSGYSFLSLPSEPKSRTCHSSIKSIVFNEDFKIHSEGTKVKLKPFHNLFLFFRFQPFETSLKCFPYKKQNTSSYCRTLLHTFYKYRTLRTARIQTMKETEILASVICYSSTAKTYVMVFWKNLLEIHVYLLVSLIIRNKKLIDVFWKAIFLSISQ